MPGIKNKERAIQKATEKANKNQRIYVITEMNNEFFTNLLSSFSAHAQFIILERDNTVVIKPK